MLLLHRRIFIAFESTHPQNHPAHKIPPGVSCLIFWLWYIIELVQLLKPPELDFPVIPGHKEPGFCRSGYDGLLGNALKCPMVVLGEICEGGDNRVRVNTCRSVSPARDNSEDSIHLQ